jgi:hypothetical protein
MSTYFGGVSVVIRWPVIVASIIILLFLGLLILGIWLVVQGKKP